MTRTTEENVQAIVRNINGIRQFALEVARDFDEKDRFYIEMTLRAAADAFAVKRETERMLRENTR